LQYLTYIQFYYYWGRDISILIHALLWKAWINTCLYFRTVSYCFFQKFFEGIRGCWSFRVKFGSN